MKAEALLLKRKVPTRAMDENFILLCLCFLFYDLGFFNCGSDNSVCEIMSNIEMFTMFYSACQNAEWVASRSHTHCTHPSGVVDVGWSVYWTADVS